MSKKIMQTAKAKKEFWSPILPYIENTKTVTELATYMCVSNRRARDEINLIRKHYAVISGSFRKGYRLAKKFNTLSLEEKEQERNLALRSVNEFQSRIQDMKKSMKPLIAYIKAIEKEIEKEKQKKK